MNIQAHLRDCDVVSRLPFVMFSQTLPFRQKTLTMFAPVQQKKGEKLLPTVARATSNYSGDCTKPAATHQGP